MPQTCERVMMSKRKTLLHHYIQRRKPHETRRVALQSTCRFPALQRPLRYDARRHDETGCSPSRLPKIAPILQLSRAGPADILDRVWLVYPAVAGTGLSIVVRKALAALQRGTGSSSNSLVAGVAGERKSRTSLSAPLAYDKALQKNGCWHKISQTSRENKMPPGWKRSPAQSPAAILQTPMRLEVLLYWIRSGVATKVPRQRRAPSAGMVN